MPTTQAAGMRHAATTPSSSVTAASRVVGLSFNRPRSPSRFADQPINVVAIACIRKPVTILNVMLKGNQPSRTPCRAKNA